MLSVTMPSVIMLRFSRSVISLSVIMLSIIIESFVMLSAVMLSVIILSVVAPQGRLEPHFKPKPRMSSHCGANFLLF
jgi:hypothetical protein